MSAMVRTVKCPACGADALVRREPVYEGFKKVGERVFCSACGHELPDEGEGAGSAGAGLAGLFGEDERPRRPSVFGDEDRPSRPRLFDESDRPVRPDVFVGDDYERICLHCRHYVVNPFTQRCGLHGCVVQATDSCPDYAAKKERRDADDDES